MRVVLHPGIIGLIVPRDVAAREADNVVFRPHFTAMVVEVGTGKQRVGGAVVVQLCYGVIAAACVAYGFRPVNGHVAAHFILLGNVVDRRIVAGIFAIRCIEVFYPIHILWPQALHLAV